MKKQIVFACLMVLAALVSSAAMASGPAGFVAAVSGDAQVVRGGQSQPVTLGMQILEGDRLKTGAKARMKVLLSDDSVLALGSKTEVVVTEQIFDSREQKRSTQLDLVSGKVRSLVQKEVAGQKANFEIHTGNAVAGVRGTEFVVAADGQETLVCTLSGAVDFAGADGKRVLVAAGQSSSTGAGRETSAPVMVAAADVKELKDATDAEQHPTELAWNVEVSPKNGLGSRGSKASGGRTLPDQVTQNGTLGGEPTPQKVDQPGAPSIPPGSQGAFVGISYTGDPFPGSWGWNGPPTQTVNFFRLHVTLAGGKH